MKAVHAVAENYDRTLDYGLRVHMIVRDTEAEAQEYADYIVSKLDDEYGRAIRERALDSTSLGVAHQARNRDMADEYGYVEPGLWTGVGRARSGCGAALWSDRPIRLCPRSRNTRRWASALSSSRATRIWTKPAISVPARCRT